MLGRGESIGGASPPLADRLLQHLEHDPRDDLCPFRVWVTGIAEVFFPQAAAEYRQGDIQSFAELFQPSVVVATGNSSRRKRVGWKQSGVHVGDVQHDRLPAPS